MDRPTVISLFSGAGGLDFGFEAAGFRTAVAIELDEVCAKSISANRPKWPLVQGDIRRVSSRRILRKAGLRKGDADVVVGGPPCQPFSKSGYWARGYTRRLDDPRADLLMEFVRVLRDTKPKAFLLENVRGLTYRGKDEGLRLLVDEISAIGRNEYKVSCQTLNAADFGVPQIRERVFLVGSRDGLDFEFPAATHSDPSADRNAPGGALLPYRTAWDAIGDLPCEVDDPSLEVGGKWGDLLPTIPEGENYLFHTDRGEGHPLFGWRRRYWNFLLKLAKNRPGWTIQAHPGTATGPFHWANRRLTTHELCRLQTFPEKLRIEASRGDVQRMLGNAVPSLLAEVLAREIRRQLLGHRVRRKPRLLREPLDAPPAPEPASPLPAKYRVLLGDHAAHPGTGRGPAYCAQWEAELAPA